MSELPTDSRCLVIFSHSNTREPFAVLGTVLDELAQRRNTVQVLDLSGLGDLTTAQPGRFISRILSIQQVITDVSSIAKQFGARVVEPDFDPLLSLLSLEESEEQELIDSALSSTLSYFRDDKLRGSRFEGAKFKESLQRARYVLSWLSNYLNGHPDIETVVVANGRSAMQRACILAAERLNRSLLYYEIGRASQKAAYIGPHRIHDRDGTQKQASEKTKPISSDEVLEIAAQWFGERVRPQSDLNQFSNAWNSKDRRLKVSKPDDSELAVFFSSSADEFTALGPEWDLQEWSDQYEAFHAILREYEQRGIACVLRVHPNLANKSSRHFWSEVGKIRRLLRDHPDLTVVWPHQPLDSYSLVEKADYVIVARSTIGLEASLMGKCVWTTTPARYDQLADVRRVWGPEDVSTANLSLWQAEPLGASRWVAHLVLSDFPFSSQMKSIAPWNSAKPPWNVRLGNFLTRQPFRHKVHLIALEIGRIIHSRIPSIILSRRSFGGSSGVVSKH